MIATTFTRPIYKEQDGEDVVLEFLTVTVEFDPQSSDEYVIDSHIVSVVTERGNNLWEGADWNEKVQRVMDYKREVSPDYYKVGDYYTNIRNWASNAVNRYYEQ